MREAEFIVGLDEVFGAELFIVWLTFGLDIAGTPTRVNEFPCAIIDLDSVPSMTTWVSSGNWSA